MSRSPGVVVVLALLAAACAGTPAAPPAATPAATLTPAAATAAPTPAFAPSKPVELVVQAAAGGGSDIFARKISDLLTKEKFVTQPINVVNKPGGSGAVAYAYLAQKKPDPHYLATVTLSYLATPLQQNTGFTYQDFTNLVTLATDDFAGVVRADAPYGNLKDLVEAAKAKPKQIRVGETQLGSSDTIISNLIEQATGAKFNHITFNSAGEVNAALLGGSVDVAWANPGEALQLVQGKKLKFIAAFSPVRLKGIDVATAKEQGIDVTWEQFRGIVAPGGLTESQRAYWEETLLKITKTADWEKYLDENLLRPLVQRAAQVDQYLDRENARLKQVLIALGVIK